jgi:hypothetical protein
MSKNTNLSFLTDYITADITNGRIGINNASPTVAFDVVGVVSTSTSTYLATASGNVGIGTTTPNQILSVRKTSAGAETIALALQNISQNPSTAVAMIFCPHENSTTPEPLAKISAIRTATSGAPTDIAFYTYNTGLSEKMRITATGNVGIGTSSPGLNLSVQGLYGLPATSGVQGTGIFRVQDSASNIALDMGVIQNAGNWIQSGNKANSAVLPLALNPSGGNIGVGTSTPASAGGTYTSIDIRGTGGGALVMGTTATLMSYFYVDAGGLNVQTTGSIPILFIPGGTERMRIRSTGQIVMNNEVFNTNTSGTTRTLFIGNGNFEIGGVSSIRASKKNIENLSNVDWLYQLNPVAFNYRKKDEDGSYTEEIYKEINYGLIAEDTESIAEFLINYNDKIDGNKEMIGIEYSRLITPMLKAIQELSAEITILKNK